MIFPIFSMIALILFFNVAPVDAPNSNEANSKILSEISFWSNKKSNAPEQYTYNVPLASAYSQLYERNARIDDLLMAGHLLEEAVAHTPVNSRSGLLRTLAQHYISRHEFCKAENLMLQADALGEGKHENDMIHFDLAMEMGREDQALSYLNKLAPFNDFQYLIRRAKWEDSKGNLDRAILWLNDAKKIAELDKDQGQLYWIYSNLGDFYGHQKDITQSMHHYNKALEIKEDDWYSQKGMLWETYSNEKNYAATLEGISLLQKESSDPSLLLWKAETSMLMGDRNAYLQGINEFINITSSPKYGNMYRAYLSDIFCRKESFKPETALLLAMEEIQERPTPESYSLLVQALYHQGKIEKAVSLAQMHVLHRTEEPKALLRLKKIEALGPETHQMIIAALKEAEYELGPFLVNQSSNL